MTDCYNNLVGLKGCTEDTPTSGMYVNTLPGISTELAQNIIDSDSNSYSELWSDVIANSFSRIRQDVLNSMPKLTHGAASFNRVFFNTERIEQKYPKELIAKDSVYRGKYIECEESYYSTIHIRSIQIWSANQVGADIVIFDMITGEELYNEHKQINAGINTISLNQTFNLSFNELRLFVGVDCTNMDTYKTENQSEFESLSLHLDCGECSSWGDLNGFSVQNTEIDVSDDKHKGNLDYTSGKGVQVLAQVGCSIDSYLCDNADLFKDSWRYLLGSELLRYKLASPNLSYFAQYNLEQTKLIADSYYEDYRTTLETALMHAPKDGWCFGCDNIQEIQYNIGTP